MLPHEYEDTIEEHGCYLCVVVEDFRDQKEVELDMSTGFCWRQDIRTKDRKRQLVLRVPLFRRFFPTLFVKDLGFDICNRRVCKSGKTY